MSNHPNIKIINNHEETVESNRPKNHKNFRNEITKFNLKLHRKKEEKNKTSILNQNNTYNNHVSDRLNLVIKNNNEANNIANYSIENSNPKNNSKIKEHTKEVILSKVRFMEKSSEINTKPSGPIHKVYDSSLQSVRSLSKGSKAINSENRHSRMFSNFSKTTTYRINPEKDEVHKNKFYNSLNQDHAKDYINHPLYKDVENDIGNVVDRNLAVRFNKSINLKLNTPNNAENNNTGKNLFKILSSKRNDL